MQENLEQHINDTELALFKEEVQKNLTEDKFKRLTDKNIQNMLDSYHKAHTPWLKVNHQNRNDLCSCGSGKKFKKCCVNKKSEYRLKKKLL